MGFSIAGSGTREYRQAWLGGSQHSLQWVEVLLWKEKAPLARERGRVILLSEMILDSRKSLLSGNASQTPVSVPSLYC